MQTAPTHTRRPAHADEQTSDESNYGSRIFVKERSYAALFIKKVKTWCAVGFSGLPLSKQSAGQNNNGGMKMIHFK